MASNEQKAQQLIAEAQKKLNSSQNFLKSLFSGSSKVEDAIECYQKAGNLFKISKNWSSAGAAFSEAADLHGKAGSRHDAAINYVNASNCYKKSDIDEAVRYLVYAIEIYTDMGRFTMAAKLHQNIAEMYEMSESNLEQTVSHYEQAADYYRGEENNSLANKCLLKVAQYATQLEDYDKAIPIYQQVATYCLKSSLIKYSVKDYFFRAALCHLCVDTLNAQNAIKEYIQMFPAFQDSREYKLCMTLIEHIEEQNLEGFTEALKTYDSISRLDSWFTMILLRIKKSITDKPDLR